jgi:hypothetical protein
MLIWPCSPWHTYRDQTEPVAVINEREIGMSGPTYEKAKAVIASGDTELIEEMLKRGKINGAHRKLACLS